MNIDIEISGPGFLAAMVAMSAFLAAAGVNAASGRTGLLFVSSLLMWLSYLAAHKLSVGKLVDGKPLGREKEDMKDEKMAPKNTTEYFGSLAGASLLVTGMGVGAMGLQELNLPVTFVGALLFNTGYVVAHVSTTGELL